MAHRAQKFNGKTWRQCRKKTRYADEYQAEKAAKDCMRNRPQQRLRVYDCPDCDGWHLTHKPA